ncbi:MAG: hypothetical protein AB7H88_05865 [Vicinamibacterales bacterium]
MQERRLRPGDALDDYCPRERRITDHAVVAMIDDTIKQTRCVSCDTEHEYKHARIPAQRRKRADTALFTQVLDGLNPPSARIASRLDDEPDDTPAAPPEAPAAAPPTAPEPAGQDAPRAAAATDEAAADDGDGAPAGHEAADQPPVDEFPDEGPIRRRLFRAQLPRHEGQQTLTRTLPDFTVRQPGSGRGARPGGPGQGQGQGQGRRRGGGGQHGGGQNRFGSGRGGQGQGGGRGPGQGQGQGQGQGRRRRGKKK